MSVVATTGTSAGVGRAAARSLSKHRSAVAFGALAALGTVAGHRLARA